MRALAPHSSSNASVAGSFVEAHLLAQRVHQLALLVDGRPLARRGGGCPPPRDDVQHAVWVVGPGIRELARISGNEGENAAHKLIQRGHGAHHLRVAVTQGR